MHKHQHSCIKGNIGARVSMWMHGRQSEGYEGRRCIQQSARPDGQVRSSMGTCAASGYERVARSNAFCWNLLYTGPYKQHLRCIALPLVYSSESQNIILQVMSPARGLQ